MSEWRGKFYNSLTRLLIHSLSHLPVYPIAPGQQPHPLAVLPRIGFVLDTFPATSETFILREVQQLLKDGVPLTLAAFRAPAHIVHVEALQVAARVQYRPAPWKSSFLSAAIPQMIRPRFWGLAAVLLVECRKEPAAGIRLLWHLLPTAAWMAGVFKAAGVRHVHSHFAGAPGLAGRSAARLLDATFSLSVHGSDLFGSDPFREGNVRRANFVLACTAVNQQLIMQRYGKDLRHVHLVYHGLDLDRFSPGSTPPDRNDPILMCVARLVPKKGIDTLLEACKLLMRTGIRVRCEIFGDGPERSTLQNCAHQLELQDHVVFRGACSQEEVLEGYRRAALFVLACRVAGDGDQDGLPNVIVEAMAMGVPVVSTPVGAVTELVKHGETGWLVPPDDPEALAEEIAKLLRSPERARAVAAAGRSRVAELFDLKLDRVKRVFEQEILS